MSIKNFTGGNISTKNNDLIFNNYELNQYSQFSQSKRFEQLQPECIPLQEKYIDNQSSDSEEDDIGYSNFVEDAFNLKNDHKNKQIKAVSPCLNQNSDSNFISEDISFGKIKNKFKKMIKEFNNQFKNNQYITRARNRRWSNYSYFLQHLYILIKIK